MGFLKLQTTDQELIGVEFLTKRGHEVSDKMIKRPTILETTKAQLLEYLEGRRQNFDLNLKLVGSPYSVQVWQWLLRIPFGSTLSYGELALQMGSVKQARAIGRACGLNPIPIIVPCHRVIAANGSLHGFSGGLDKKAYLLKHEKKWLTG